MSLRCSVRCVVEQNLQALELCYSQGEEQGAQPEVGKLQNISQTITYNTTVRYNKQITKCNIRVSKSCNHAITRLCKIYENLRKCLTNKRETVKNCTNFMYLSHFFLLFHIFLYPFYACFCAFFLQSEHWSG